MSEDKMAIKRLQEDVIQMKKEPRQNKSGYNQNETETLKIQFEAERQKVAKLQESLAAEMQEKAELQSTVQKLKVALQSKGGYDIKTEQEVQKYKNLCDAEKENAAKTQKALKERTQETLTLEKEKHELQLKVRKLEEDLKQSKIDYGNKITEEIQMYKNLYDVEKENAAKTQKALKEKTQETLTLKKEKQELQLMVEALKQSKIDYDSKTQEALTKVSAETPSKDQNLKIPAKDQQIETPSKDHKSKTPAKDQQTKTPAKDQKIKTPAKDQQAETPAKDQQTETPAKDQTPEKDQQTETPAKDQQTKTPAKGQTPEKDQQTATLADHDQHTERPVKDDREIPVKDQITEVPVGGKLKISQAKEPPKHQLMETPRKDNHIEDPTKSQPENHSKVSIDDA